MKRYPQTGIVPYYVMRLPEGKAYLMDYHGDTATKPMPLGLCIFLQHKLNAKGHGALYLKKGLV